MQDQTVIHPSAVVEPGASIGIGVRIVLDFGKLMLARHPADEKQPCKCRQRQHRSQADRPGFGLGQVGRNGVGVVRRVVCRRARRRGGGLIAIVGFH